MSFMKKVAKIAAPFASFIPGIGPLIGAGLGLLGNLGGGSSSKNKNQSQSIFSDPAFLAALNNSQAAGKQLMDTGSPLVGSGSGYLRNSGDYLQSILHGGPAQDKALAGPISDLKTGSQAQLATLSQFAPRSSTASLLSDHQSKLTSGIARLRYGAQTDASTNLANIGNMLLGQGTNLMTGGANTMQSVLQTLLGRMGLQNQSQIAADQRRSDMFGNLGEGFGNILGILLGPGGLLNKGSSGSNSKPTYDPSLSDVRLKQNVETIATKGSIRYVRFQWKPSAMKYGLSGWATGVIAQEIEPLHPDLIGHYDGYLTVNYSGLEKRL